MAVPLDRPEGVLIETSMDGVQVTLPDPPRDVDNDALEQDLALGVLGIVFIGLVMGLVVSADHSTPHIGLTLGAIFLFGSFYAAFRTQPQPQPPHPQNHTAAETPRVPPERIIWLRQHTITIEGRDIPLHTITRIQRDDHGLRIDSSAPLLSGHTPHELQYVEQLIRYAIEQYQTNAMDSAADHRALLRLLQERC